MDDLQDQIRAWTDVASSDAEPVTAAEARARAGSARGPRRDQRSGRRVVLVAAAAAVLVVVVITVVATAPFDRGQNVTTDGPGPTDDEVVFEVLATHRTSDPPGTLRATFSPEGLDALWAGSRNGGAVPVVDFATQVVVSMTALGNGCREPALQFDRAGSDLTPVLVYPRGECQEGPVEETFVVSLDWASTGPSFRISLPADVSRGATRTTLDVARPLPPPAQPAVWPHGDTLADRSSPEATARSFMTQVVGAAGANMTVAAMAPSGGATPVAVDLGTTSTTVLTVRSGTGWIVEQVGEPSATISTDGASARIPSAPGAATLEARVDTDLGITTIATVVDVPTEIDLPPGRVRSIVSVQRDGSGRLVDVTGEALS